MDQHRGRAARRRRRPRRRAGRPTSSKLSPDSSRQLPSPLERGSSTPSSVVAARARRRPSPSSIVQPRSVEVAAHERPVVVVAGDAPPVEVVEGGVQRVQRERLPALARRGVVAGVEDRGRPAGVADRAGDRRPCRCCRAGRRPGSTTVSPSCGLGAGRGRRPARRRRRRTSCSCRRCRPRSRSAAGSARSSRRRAPRCRGPRRAAAPPGRGTCASDIHVPASSSGVAARGPTAATARAPSRATSPSASSPARPAGRPQQLAPAPRPEQQPAQRPAAGPSTAPRSAASTASSRSAALDLGDLALGLAGEVGVAPGQLRRSTTRRSCRARSSHADARAGVPAHVGQHRAGVQHDLAVERRLEHRVVAGEHDARGCR